MHIKICGITNIDDALAAVEAGADMLGFNLYPKSPRCISPADCRTICGQIAKLESPVSTVGIFVNESAANVTAILDHCGLDLAQLHGDEPPEMLTLLWGRAYKGLRGAVSDQLPRFAAVSPGFPSLLVDSYSPHLYGGSGETGDWSAARSVAEVYPILLAGGLTPENVAAAVAQVQPWGVDTASGVEASPGRKDHARIRAFVVAAREAEQSLISDLQLRDARLEIGD